MKTESYLAHKELKLVQGQSFWRKGRRKPSGIYNVVKTLEQKCWQVKVTERTNENMRVRVRNDICNVCMALR